MHHITKFKITESGGDVQKFPSFSAPNPSRALARQFVQQRPYDMALGNHFTGRREGKRLPVVMDVEIASVKSASSERGGIARVDNLSADGARVYVKGPWQLGEDVEITTAVEAPMRANVIYCQKLGGRFAIGLKFHSSLVLWSIFQRLEGMIR